MNDHTLTTPKEADELIARMFVASNTCRMSVREDKAFKANGWLSLGDITLDASTNTSPEYIKLAAKRGGFEWKLPIKAEVERNLAGLLGLNDIDKSRPKIRRALDAIAAIGTRTGLQSPKFDPSSLEAMPFRKSMTVVADTSGALQGGLDFVARQLHPAARIKVPAIVQMEIVNLAERFLVGRRTQRTRTSDLLIDHLLSQGGQRVLLRLELHAETEIERTFILGDPLRGAFQADKDTELADLNLSIAIRAYADRLILEAARQHQAQANLGHKVQLLTSDQGLARMAIAEGIVPLFFASVVADDLFGKRLTGSNLDPFTGSLRETSIASVLWEIATAFGSVRIENNNGKDRLQVSAIGEGLSWSPYHSHGDLLWCEHQKVPSWPKTKDQAPSSDKGKAENTNKIVVTVEPENQKDPSPPPSPLAIARQPGSFLRFNVDRLFLLIHALDTRQKLVEAKVQETLGVKSIDALDEYRRFLISGELISVKNREWKIAQRGQALATALRNEDLHTIKSILANASSFATFLKWIENLPVGEPIGVAELKRGATTFRILGEVTGVSALIFGEGIYATPNNPSTSEFATVALARYGELDQGDGLVATGAWLEALIRTNGIHPEIARNRLNDASTAKSLRRTTEGSTTDVRLDQHSIHVLRIAEGKPRVAEIHLYRGDYLIPGKSSTSLRIERL
jgi:hypothetical protein